MFALALTGAALYGSAARASDAHEMDPPDEELADHSDGDSSDSGSSGSSGTAGESSTASDGSGHSGDSGGQSGTGTDGSGSHGENADSNDTSGSSGSSPTNTSTHAPPPPPSPPAPTEDFGGGTTSGPRTTRPAAPRPAAPVTDFGGGSTEPGADPTASVLPGDEPAPLAQGSANTNDADPAGNGSGNRGPIAWLLGLVGLGGAVGASTKKTPEPAADPCAAVRAQMAQVIANQASQRNEMQAQLAGMRANPLWDSIDPEYVTLEHQLATMLASSEAKLAELGGELSSLGCD